MPEQLSAAERAAIILRIKKLLAKGAPESGAPAPERETCQRIAQVLMRRMGLSLAEIEEAPDTADSYLSLDTDLGGKRNERSWRRILIVVIAEAHDCRAVYWPKTTRAQIIGEPEDCRAVQREYSRIAGEIEHLCAIAWSQYQAWPDIRQMLQLGLGEYRSRFGRGAAIECYAMYRERQSARERARAMEAEATALVVAEDRSGAASDARDRIHPDLEQEAKAPGAQKQADDASRFAELSGRMAARARISVVPPESRLMPGALRIGPAQSAGFSPMDVAFRILAGR